MHARAAALDGAGGALLFRPASTAYPEEAFSRDEPTTTDGRMRTQAPRGVTLAIAFVLWLIGALELLAKVDLPYNLGQWALLACGALLLLGCLLRGL
jgi:hypothetical protein